MTAHFPANYKCDAETRDAWPEMEAKMLPLIEIKARRIRNWAGVGMDLEDALQEGRLALLSAIASYDYSKGDLDPYVGVVLDNTYKTILYKMLSQTRMPQAYTYNGEEWVKSPSPPLSLSDMDLDSSEDLSPEVAASYVQLEEQARIFKLKLLNTLKGRDKAVFECRTNPPVRFLKKVEEWGGDKSNPTNLHIARYLNVGKNAVDWSLYKIRELFTRQARETEFSDLFGDVVDTNRWPMICMSKKAKHDLDFVQHIIKSHDLDPKPFSDYHLRPDHHQESGIYSRIIERYSWGVVLILRRGAVSRTLVIEGKFNVPMGDVFGDCGTHEKIPVKWYSELVRELKRSKP